MFHRAALIRAVAIPACLIWGLVELLALQRTRLFGHRGTPTV